jgi:magnesium transporter
METVLIDITTLKNAVKHDDAVHIQLLEQETYAPDVALFFNDFTDKEAQYVYAHLSPEFAAEVLLELDEEQREHIMSALTSKEIAEQIIDNLDTDDAADVLNELSEEKQEEVLAQMTNMEHSSDIVDLLNYDEDTAGGLMAKELIQANANWSAQKCIGEMREQAEKVETVYAVYVVDDDEKLLGLLSLKKLLLAPQGAMVKDIYDQDIIAVKTNTPREEVAQIIKKYDLVVLPVIDTLGRLVGRITIDDVVDVMQEEAEKDYQSMAGISGDINENDSVFESLKSRLPWLLVAMVGGVLGSRVIAHYEGVIQLHPEMASFIPMIAAMGGNVGVQSSAIIVQGLANNSIQIKDITPRLFKELGTGLLNGLVCSVLILIYNLFTCDSLALTYTVSIALMSAIVFASVFGTFVPLLLNKYKVDPALATGPFITTTNDILGAFIYFSIGHFLYGMF